MCLNPRIIRNKRYIPNKKNDYKPPICDDDRKLFVSIGCGICSECASKKANDWKIRLMEEYNHDPDCTFVNLTISDEQMDIIVGKLLDTEANTVAKFAIRHFLEKIRKQTGKSVKHFFITELGQTNTERVHIHGFIWGIKKYNEIKQNNVTGARMRNLLLNDKWNYGYIYIGDYVNEKTISYITKYITKTDEKHPDFIGKIFCSKGIGSNYLNRTDSNKHTITGEKKKPTKPINTNPELFPAYLHTIETKYGMTMNASFFGLKNLMNKFDT